VCVCAHTFEGRSTLLVNESLSCHYECVMSHMNGFCHAWMGHVSENESGGACVHVGVGVWWYIHCEPRERNKKGKQERQNTL